MVGAWKQASRNASCLPRNDRKILLCFTKVSQAKVPLPPHWQTTVLKEIMTSSIAKFFFNQIRLLNILYKCLELRQRLVQKGLSLCRHRIKEHAS